MLDRVRSVWRSHCCPLLTTPKVDFVRTSTRGGASAQGVQGLVRRFIGVVLACLLVSGAGGVAVLTPANAASTGNSSPHPGRIVSDNPSGFTPHVMDGQVQTLAQVGNMIIVGGSFTTVRNAGSTTDIPRRNLFAFNATTGQISTTFVPNPNSTVYKVLPAADGTSVYLGGSFTSITSGGTNASVSRLTKLSVATGTRDTGFYPGSFNGQVRDLELTGSRLWVAGKFTHVQGTPSASTRNSERHNGRL